MPSLTQSTIFHDFMIAVWHDLIDDPSTGESKTLLYENAAITVRAFGALSYTSHPSDLASTSESDTWLEYIFPDSSSLFILSDGSAISNELPSLQSTTQK